MGILVGPSVFGRSVGRRGNEEKEPPKQRRCSGTALQKEGSSSLSASLRLMFL